MRNRRDSVVEKGGEAERWMFRRFAHLMSHPKLYRGSEGLIRFGAWLWKPVKGKKWDPLKAWTATRDLPSPARKSFHRQWKERSR
jgi:hypothetical protein